MHTQISTLNKSGFIAIRRIITGMTTAVLFGGFMGQTLTCLLIFCSAHLSWNSYQFYRLQKWLHAPVISSLPESIGIWGAVFDTIRKLQSEQHKHISHLESIIEHVEVTTKAFRDGAIMTNRQGELRWWNEAANTLLGLKADLDTGQAITNYIRNPAFKTYFDSGDYTHPIEITSPVNHEKTLEFYITLVGDKERLVVCKDVSQLKQVEAMRQDFIANASHELRTPLTVISGYLETFIDYKNELPPKWGRALSQMHQQSLRMQNLISDLLQLSQLESNIQTQASHVSLRPLLTQIVNDAKALSGGKHRINLDCEDIEINGIEVELSSAFSNVIFNAVKYTPQHGHINIRCFANKDGLQLWVKDTGIGINASHLSRLTERFYRADPSRHSDTGGTGLGLAIVKHILLRHDGYLEVQSEIGKGSTFICHLPVACTYKTLPLHPLYAS